MVDATTGEFEAGFEAGGQSREHAILVRSLGVRQMIIAVNKMDTVSCVLIFLPYEYTELKIVVCHMSFSDLLAYDQAKSNLVYITVHSL